MSNTTKCPQSPQYQHGRQAFLDGVPVGTVLARLRFESPAGEDADLDYVGGFLDQASECSKLIEGFYSGLTEARVV